jgi:hypothetical protein
MFALELNSIFLVFNTTSSVLLANLCVFSSVVALIFVGYVFANRKYSTVSNQNDEKTRAVVQNFITELLFSEYDTVANLNDYGFLFKNNNRKQLLIAEMIKLHDSLYGEEAQKLEKFYLESGLIKQSYKKVKSTNKDLVLSGLGELVEMRSFEYLSMLEGLLKGTFDNELKNYLTTAILKLDPKRGLDLILNADHFLTDWFQLIIIKEIDDLKFNDFPPLEEWQKKGSSVAVFGERLHSFKNTFENPFDQNIELKTDEIALQESENVLEETAEVATNQIKASNIENALLEIYLSESPETQEEIRNTLKLLKSKIILPDIPPKTEDTSRKRQKDVSVFEKLKIAFKPNKNLGLYFLNWKNKIKPKR